MTLPDDSELLTRHEVQAAPPDLCDQLLDARIHADAADRTYGVRQHAGVARRAVPTRSFWSSWDEAHLYRGAAGAEVGLLLRRLRARLGISHERFQVICATASFQDHEYAPEFGAQLSGSPVESFRPITGSLKLKPNATAGTDDDAVVLASVDLQGYYEAATDQDRPCRRPASSRLPARGG